MPKRAVSSATTRSHTSVSSQPPPSACPCTAAITGVGDSSTARNAVTASVTYARRSAVPPMSPKPAMSPPTEKQRPSPWITTTRTSGSAPAASTASRSSEKKPCVMALSFSGRSIVHQATASRTSYLSIGASPCASRPAYPITTPTPLRPR